MANEATTCPCCGKEREAADLVSFAANPDIAVCRNCVLALRHRAHPDAPLLDVVPVLATRDLDRAVEHYRTLGFEVSTHDGGGYAFLSWGAVNIHLGEFRELDPLTSAVSLYLYVRDAAALHERWSTSDLGGRFHAPMATDYGLMEGAHVDPDGNLVRYGSSL